MFNFPKMPKFSKLVENAFKTFDKGFEQVEEAFDQLDEEMPKLDRDLKDIKPGEEKETVTEERRPDGTVITTRTVIRKTS